MPKTAVMFALLFPAAAFAALAVPVPGTQTQPPAQSWTASVIVTPGARASVQLSMGPDPGGKTGATVTPSTTGQPGADGATGASNQSGASAAAVKGAANAGTDSHPNSSSEPLKQPRDSSKQPAGTTGAGPTSPAPSGQSGNSR